ncbi:hypothetical protein RM6536_1555 [Rothia mucilaginosa]|uniref:Uncharacterized protein n=1 Tax=Rothia mucilaginosa TaxID=43675 RepID=A0A0K2S1W3_9MICC|nr:hypothetical protein RM6536_1555 [Rothia mucilaginosa]
MAHAFVPHLAGLRQINSIFNARIPATGTLRSHGVNRVGAGISSVYAPGC